MQKRHWTIMVWGARRLICLPINNEDKETGDTVCLSFLRFKKLGNSKTCYIELRFVLKNKDGMSRNLIPYDHHDKSLIKNAFWTCYEECGWRNGFLNDGEFTMANFDLSSRPFCEEILEHIYKIDKRLELGDETNGWISLSGTVYQETEVECIGGYSRFINYLIGKRKEDQP